MFDGRRAAVKHFCWFPSAPPEASSTVAVFALSFLGRVTIVCNVIASFTPADPRLVWALAASVGGLCLGPLLALLAGQRRLPAAALGGVVLGLVPIIVGLRLLPELMASVGWLALPLAVAGFGVLHLIDRHPHHGHDGGTHDEHAHHPPHTHRAPWVVVAALTLHAVGDGAILFGAAASSGASGALLLALGIHRLPEGLFVSEAFAGRRRQGLLALLLLVLGTFGGALLVRWSAATWVGQIEPLLDGLAAVGFGGMFHVILHRPHRATPRSAERLVERLGLVGGAALGLLAPGPAGLLGMAPASELSLGQAVPAMFIAAAPALLLGWAAEALLARADDKVPWPLRAEGLVGTLPSWIAAGATSSALLGSSWAIALLSVALPLRVLAPLVELRRPAGLSTATATTSATTTTGNTALQTTTVGSAERPPGSEGPLLGRALLGLLLCATAEALLPSTGTPALTAIPLALLAISLRLGPVGAPLVAALLLHKGLASTTVFSTAVAVALLSPSLRRQTLLCVAVAIGSLLPLALGSVLSLALAPPPPLHALLERAAHRSGDQLASAALLLLLVTEVLRRGPGTLLRGVRS
jgi:zinc transporter ZupT